MRVPRGLWVWWRSAIVPLTVWLLLVVTGTGLLFWQQRDSRRAVIGRYDAGVRALGESMAGVATGQLATELVQAQAALSDPVVTARDFNRVVAGFGFPSAVLLDAQGRILRNFPANPATIGLAVGGRYAFLGTALQGQPAVSQVVSGTADGTPVVGFAVPFSTTSGRRVFSGAIPIHASPLASYLSTALSLTGARVQLVDSGGKIVAATTAFDVDAPTLAASDSPLATALTRAANGRYRAGGKWWRYSSVAVGGTPWRLSATVREKVLFSSLIGNEMASRAALAGAALVGLALVAAAGKAEAGRLELMLSERRFRKVFDDSRVGMLLADVQGRCLRVNPAACEIFGRTEPELIGRPVDDFTHPDDIGLSHESMEDCLTGRTDHLDLSKRYIRADGRIVHAAVSSVVLRDEENRPQYFATQIVDTTEQLALEEERERAQADLARHAEQLQEANIHLADVMAMLSHDVRQPLAKIVGLGGLLNEEWNVFPEHTKIDYVTRMVAAGHRANDLVTDILMLAQFDAGAMQARPARIDVAQAAREAVAAHQISAATPMTVIAPDQTTGLADPAQLQLILGNLLTNAAKYGRPPIEVIVANTGEQVAIRVADHGEGVPPEFVPHLFDRFARAESGVATTTPGTGLGLYLVRQLAQAGGLDVTYEPNQPHGAIFTLTVPRVSPSPRVRAAAF